MNTENFHMINIGLSVRLNKLMYVWEVNNSICDHFDVNLDLIMQIYFYECLQMSAKFGVLSVILRRKQNFVINFISN